MKKIAFIIVLLFLTNCSSVPLYEYPPDWKLVTKRDSTINYYSQWLKGKKIFLDPGHGGEDRRNTNRSGDVIEADVNLRVALNLKNYFERAGVSVLISRQNDMTVPLAYRSELANLSGADLFISIHHNAPAKWEDDWTNYTSTYYHAKETDYEYEPNERDLARYIQRDISYVMGNPGGLGSFDGTYSDYIIYPGEGFSVLRKTTIPSVLVECAFHTSRLEELRLNEKEFNEIQAWGIFRGVAKYFRAGIPEIELMNNATIDDTLKLSFALSDSTGISAKSILVYYDKEEIDHSFDPVGNILDVILGLEYGEHELKIICANINGNHSLPFNKKIIVDSNYSASVE
ncbi:MAG: N-acetylmuramoyl-L-alanine amidase [Bacteroidota bacterium]